MTQAYCTSPFSFADDIESPWILWEKKNAVTALPDPDETDSRYLSNDKELASTVLPEYSSNQVSSQPIIQRTQYNAVLSRMNQAAGKTGSFSAWKS